MNANDSSELDWLAFRYAAGELSAAEAEQFELRLENEQPAREALARSVELGELLAHVPAHDWSAPVEPARRGARTWLHYAAWALVGAAACLLVVFASGKFGGEHRRFTPSGSPELAEAWSRGFEEPVAVPAVALPADEELAAMEAFESETSEAESEAVEPESAVAPAPLAVPSWMVAAVAKDDLPQHPDNDDSDVRIE